LEEVKPSKNGTREQIIHKDTQEILKKLEKKYRDWDYIMMSKDGKNVSTQDFLDICKNKNIVFVI
jgi:23S rRNA pseudoU1915 N3-methylase RlmH